MVCKLVIKKLARLNWRKLFGCFPFFYRFLSWEKSCITKKINIESIITFELQHTHTSAPVTQIVESCLGLYSLGCLFLSDDWSRNCHNQDFSVKLKLYVDWLTNLHVIICNFRVIYYKIINYWLPTRLKKKYIHIFYYFIAIDTFIMWLLCMA